MGMLDSVPGETNAEPAAEPESEADSAPVEAKAEPPQRVELPKPSRRQAAREANDAVMNEIKSFRETVTRQQEEYRAELRRRDEEIARLRGSYEAIQPIVQQREEAKRPDAAALHREAQDLLDRGEHSAWKAKFAEAIKAEVFEAMPRQQPQQVGPPQLDPRLQVIMTQHPEVVKHPAGLQLALLEDQKLGRVYGLPDGPERWDRAFHLAKAQLPQPQGGGPPSFDQKAAGALAAVPTGQSANGKQSRGPGVELTALERQWAKMADMSEEEYAAIVAKSHPNRVVT